MTDDASWEDRLGHASATYSRFVPGAEPERVLASMERRMGALGTFAFAAVGEMWDRPQLNRRDRSLMISRCWRRSLAPRSSSCTPRSGFATA